MENINELNKQFMGLAINLALKAKGATHPNPLVGAVITQGNKIIGTGYHHKAGDLHAEREALKDCLSRGNSPAGATLWVTLEPCCHTGRQPPCTQAIIESGIKTVVIGSRDPNPLVNGQGVDILKKAGITVISDFMRNECDKINTIFFHYITKNAPYISIKMATTIDNKIATKTGQSKWITCEESRVKVHQLRREYAAIMCAVGTVIADDPLLTCRLPNNTSDTSNAVQPIRIICDTHLFTPVTSKIVKTAHDAPVIIFYGEESNGSKEIDFPKDIKEPNNLPFNGTLISRANALKALGVNLIPCPVDKNGHVDLLCVRQKLIEKNIDSVIIEGGALLWTAAINAKIVNHIYQFIAPIIFGGKAKNAIAGNGVENISDAPQFKFDKITQYGRDILLEWDSQDLL